MAEDKEITTSVHNVISVEEFLKPMESTPGTFDWNSRITRNNFTDWLKESFKLSQGQMAAQYVIFRWCEENLEFDFKKSLENFSTSGEQFGSWDFLTDEEQTSLLEAYKGVPRHIERDKEDDIDTDNYYTKDKFLDSLENQLEGLFMDYESDDDVAEYFPIIKNIHGLSVVDFKSRLFQEIREIRKRAKALRNI